MLAWWEEGKEDVRVWKSRGESTGVPNVHMGLHSNKAKVRRGYCVTRLHSSEGTKWSLHKHEWQQHEPQADSDCKHVSLLL